MLRLDRRHRAGQEQRDERRLLPHEGNHDAAPVEQALRRQGLDQAAADQHVVEHAVLGQERTHELSRDDKRDEQRPAVEPAQHRHGAGMPAEREITGNRDRDQADQERRQQDDRQREQQVGGVVVERLPEVLEGEFAAFAAERDHAGHDERRDKEQADDGQCGRDQRQRDTAPAEDTHGRGHRRRS